MRQDELPVDRQPQPAAALGSRARAVAAPEAVENVGQIFRGDARARVADGDAHAIGDGFGL